MIKIILENLNLRSFHFSCPPNFRASHDQISQPQNCTHLTTPPTISSSKKVSQNRKSHTTHTEGFTSRTSRATDTYATTQLTIQPSFATTRSPPSPQYPNRYCIKIVAILTLSNNAESSNTANKKLLNTEA